MTYKAAHARNAVIGAAATLLLIWKLGAFLVGLALSGYIQFSRLIYWVGGDFTRSLIFLAIPAAVLAVWFTVMTLFNYFYPHTD